jgi:hypothetical protein
MGYYMEQMHHVFFIHQKDFPHVLEAIKALAGSIDELASGGSYFKGKTEKKWYSWVTTDEFLDATTVFDAIKAWRWEVAKDIEGNIDAIDFYGEKLGDDKVLFDAIAPWVKDDSYIQMSGEDGSVWRWVFSEGKCTEQNAKLVWSCNFSLKQ